MRPYRTFRVNRPYALFRSPAKKGILTNTPLLLAVIALLGGIIVLGKADAAEAGHVNCGQTITTDTILDEDLTCATGPALIIGANGITLDCARHDIIGPTAFVLESGAGVLLDGRTEVTVRNCRIRRFGFGVRLMLSSGNTLSGNTTAETHVGFELNSSNGNTLTANAARGNIMGIALLSSHGNSVAGNIAIDNNLAFGLGNFSNGNMVTGNTALNNANGFQLADGSNNTLAGNTAIANAGNGFLLSSGGNTLTDNVARGNGAHGFVMGNAHFYTLTGNHANGNNFGFRLVDSDNNEFTQNVACGNRSSDASQDEASSGNVYVDNDFCTTSGI